MAAFTGIFITEIVMTVLFLVKLIKSHDNRFRRLIGLFFITLLLPFFFFLSLYDISARPELYSLYLLLSFSTALFSVSLDLLSYLSLKMILKHLALENAITRAAFSLFRGFILIDAIMLFTNPLHGFAFFLQQHPLKNAVILFPQLQVWGQAHSYVLLLQLLTASVALFHKSVILPLIYSLKYLVFCVFTSGIFGLAIFYTYISPSFQLRSLLLSLICLTPFFIYLIIYHNRPFLTFSRIRQMVVEKLGSPMVLFDIHNLLLDYNEDAAQLFALDKILINRMTLKDFLFRAVGNQMRERSTSTVEEVTVQSPSGLCQVFKLDYTKLFDARQKSLGTLLLFHNITELKTLYNTMEKVVMTDMLTGLASKKMLEKKISEINLYRKYPYCAVVCTINGLKLISTGFGEDAEAAALMHVADVLRSHLRATDFASYADGNIVILMSNTSASEAALVFSRITDILARDTTFSFNLSFEYGIAEKLSKNSDIQLTIAQAQAILVKRKLISHSYAEASIVESLQKALRESSFETEQHSLRVQELCVRIAEKINLPQNQYEELKLLALFHDIGKLSVPKDLLSKPEKLSEEESQIMMMHTINGSKVAQSSAELASIARGILCHHEHWDGSGYPNGFSGEQIPFHARIVAVADAYDVMTHDRPWMQAMAPEVALERIKEQAGKQFDPAVVKAFLQLFRKLKKKAD